MRRGAFTMIEVIAVVMLMGLLAGATAWSLAEDARRSSETHVIGQIIREDRLARLTARRLGKPCSLRFDLNEQRAWRLVGGEKNQGTKAHSLTLSGRYRIERVDVLGRLTRTDGDGMQSADAGASASSGVVDIPYSTSGRSPGYAVRLTFHDVSRNGGGWLVVSGLTGQTTWIQDENGIDNLSAVLATGRTDAD